ncbi:MAG: Gfo/Idh/MocA family oxidoreductase [Bacteroidetes bacterium]|nr:Gfo/Idh/MocA family oxidoreductase [Bacteroidota bacterium]
MKVLIIGLGSIAKKHISAIKSISDKAEIYALRSNKHAEQYSDVVNVSDWSIANDVDFILISNPTSVHRDTILKALDYSKPLFIEKPLMHEMKGIESIEEKLRKNNVPTYVACVLRFHPVIMKLKEIMKEKRGLVEEVNVYCGSYLPEWRPDSNFRHIYSSNPALGGGVHLDLIHELDYLYWFFGQPDKTDYVLRNNSHLNIEAVDYANYRLFYKNFIANVTLNYFRRTKKREIEIIGNSFVYIGDLINCTLKEDFSNTSIIDMKGKQPNLYELQMRYFINKIQNGEKIENDFETGKKVLSIVLNK